MERSDEHDGGSDGEHPADAGQDQNRLRSTSATPKEAKLVPVKGTGLSGPFIRRPVMTVLLTLSVIVAGIATYNKLFFFSSRRRHTRLQGDWSSDVCSSD